MPDPTAPSSLPPEPAPAPGAGAPPLPSQSAEGAAASSPGSGLAPNIAAAVAALFSIFGGIAFLVLEKKNAFVRFYAMQSTILGIAWFGVAIVFTIVLMILGSIPGIGWLLVHIAELVYVGFLGLTVFTAVQAFNEKEWEIPYIGKIARQQLAKTPTAV